MRVRIFPEIRREMFRSGAIFIFVLMAIFMAEVVVAQTPLAGTDVVPVSDYQADRGTVASDVTNIPLPLLTTADTIMRLSPDEAQRGYPVDIRGVVTCVVQEHNAFIVQDETRAVFIVNASSGPLPPMGELLEVAGKTDKGTFAPLIRTSRYTDLGAGTLPQPTQPTRDQLLNGSLDDQLVEVRGIVEQAVLRPAGYGTNWSKIILRTTEGPLWIDVWLVGTNFASLTNYEDAIVRLRGCLFVALTLDTHQLDEGHIRMYVDSIDVDQPAPTDGFSAQTRHAADLTLFDPGANVFQRVKVSGQILYMTGQDYFMMDGTNGLRFTLRAPAKLHTGDMVDVVGYPELNGAAPHLRSAVARDNGHVKLPAPRNLSPDDLPNAMYDSTRVRIEGQLISLRASSSNETFEIQSGSWRFVARVKQAKLPPPPIGSRLAVIGVYAAQGGSPVLDNNVAPFDLLVHSDADVTVISKPSWWTLPRLLVIVGALVCALALLGLWVTQLHRQVEDRTNELAVQIRNRQRLEHQRVMEQERARIAQDLHDELGSGITEISMMATVAGSVPSPKNGHFDEIGERARQMVTVLDEIVWAMNPRHDSLSSLVSYLCLYADRLLKLANIACQLKGTVNLQDRAISSVNRHQVFLAFKEAITNVVRHSGATEVRLGVCVIGNRLRFVIADNGRGLPSDASTRGRDGLANMRERLARMGGRFEVRSQRERGTIVRFYMPLDDL